MTSKKEPTIFVKKEWHDVECGSPQEDPTTAEPVVEPVVVEPPQDTEIEEPTNGGVNMTTQDEMQAIKQAAQEVAQHAAEQTAQQIGEAVSQAIGKLMQTQTLTSGVSTGEARMEDIGGGERMTKENADNSQILFGNHKRTYDEYQDVSLESIKRNRTFMDKMLTDVHEYGMQKHNIANQALQNAVETANMVGKRAVTHFDIATDRSWNIDEQSHVVAEILRDNTFKEGVAAAVVNAINEAWAAREDK